MLNKIIRDYGYHKNLDAYHPDYIAAWEIAEHVPWLIKEAVKLKVNLDAAHAALRTLLGAIPCECSWHGSRSYDCVRCALEHEIGIAENLLGHADANATSYCKTCVGTTADPVMPELCQPITKKPRALEEFDPHEVASIGYEVDRGGDGD